jgi:hypothetical protein
MEEPIPKKPDSTNPAGDHPAEGAPTASLELPFPAIKLVSETIGKAELLLGYAAEAGIDAEDDVREAILTARTAHDAGNTTDQTAANLLKAFTKLAARVRPVTVDSLIACRHPKEARQTIRIYGLIAIGVGCIIVLISLITFVSNNISEKIKTDIDTANGLAAKLRAQLGPSPPTNLIAGVNKAANLSQDEIWFGPVGIPRGLASKDVISDLQQFAATMREIDAYSRQLQYFLLNFKPAYYPSTGTNWEAKRRKLELTPGLNVLLSQELTDKVEEYQVVRNIANNVQDRVVVYYGAIATCLLPVLYALLGAGAYLLRSYEDQIKNRTLSAGDRHVSRFLIAGIGGLVVGLFNVTQGVSISPFAVAFLVGYAVDVFFAFLEGLLQMFKRPAGAAGTPGIPPKM